MFIVDAHLDLAMNAMEWNRDLRKLVNEIRDSEKEMNVVSGIMPRKASSLTKKMFNDGKNAVSILVSASQHGEPAVTDTAIGSIFTHHFTRTLSNTISKKPKGSQYLPWLKLLKQTADKAFKDSQGYDVGGGKAGKQKAVFEVFIDREG